MPNQIKIKNTKIKMMFGNYFRAFLLSVMYAYKN